MDVFEEVKLKILYKAKYDEDCYIGPTNMGTSHMRRQDDLNAEHKLPVTEITIWMENYWMELNAEYCWIQKQVSPSMSERFYLNCPSLQFLPKLFQKPRVFWVEMVTMLVCLQNHL